jgi:hypothetical protein
MNDVAGSSMKYVPSIFHYPLNDGGWSVIIPEFLMTFIKPPSRMLGGLVVS